MAWFYAAEWPTFAPPLTVDAFGAAALAGLTLGVYEHSAVGRDILVALVEALGGKAVSLGRSDRFIPVDTEAVRPEDQALARQWAAELGLDAILSTDGVSRKPVVVVDEAHVYRGVFGSHLDDVAVSATKSMTGHLLGAAGAVEALFCVKALQTGMLPPTINLEHPDPECELDHVANEARRANIRVALSNSFGFGGQNNTLVVRRFET